jgi:hypothetical protein
MIASPSIRFFPSLCHFRTNTSIGDSVKDQTSYLFAGLFERQLKKAPLDTLPSGGGAPRGLVVGFWNSPDLIAAAMMKIMLAQTRRKE